MLKEAEDLLNEARDAVLSAGSKTQGPKGATAGGKTKAGSAGKTGDQKGSDVKKKKKASAKTDRTSTEAEKEARDPKKGKAGTKKIATETKKAAAGKKKTMSDDQASEKIREDDTDAEDDDDFCFDDRDDDFDADDFAGINVSTKMSLVSSYIEAFEKNGIHYDFDPDEDIIVTGFQLDCRLASAKVLIRFSDDDVTVRTLVPLKASEEVRQDVMEYITRANFGLRGGCFEMDLDDGGIFYRTYINCQGLIEIPECIILESVFFPLKIMEIYGNGLAAVMMGFSDPETEIEKAEQAEIRRMEERQAE